MKRNYLITGAITAIFLILGSAVNPTHAQESGENGKEKETLIGTWSMQKVTRNNCADKNFIGNVNMSMVDSYDKLEIRENGIIINLVLEQGRSSESRGTYSISKNTIELCLEAACQTLGYKVLNKKMTLTNLTKEEDSGCDVTVTYVFEK